MTTALTLQELKAYLRENRAASLFELTIHFNADPDSVRDMLEHWIRKNNVRKTQKSSGCNKCCQCNPLTTEVYEWIENDSSHAD